MFIQRNAPEEVPGMDREETSSATTFCASCGAKLAADATRCDACGHKVDDPVVRAMPRTTKIALALSAISIVLSCALIALTIPRLTQQPATATQAQAPQPLPTEVESTHTVKSIQEAKPTYKELVADAFAAKLEEASDLSFWADMGQGDTQITGPIAYTLIDLHDTGTPDLVVYASATRTDGIVDTPCKVLRFFAYQEDTGTTEEFFPPTASKDGSLVDDSLTLGITSSLHCIVAEDGATTKYYTSVGEADLSHQHVAGEPDFRDIDDLSLVNKLSSGTWTDVDALA